MIKETLTINIKPPITEYCSKCGYEACYSFNSIHYHCPDCGNTSIQHGPRPPEKRSVSVWSNRGSFNLCNQSDKQWQYLFRNVPNGKNYSFVVDEELSTDDPLDLATELKNIFDRYLYTSQKKEIAELLEILSTDEFQDEQHQLRTNERRLYLEYELYKLNDRTRCYQTD